MLPYSTRTRSAALDHLRPSGDEHFCIASYLERDTRMPNPAARMAVLRDFHDTRSLVSPHGIHLLCRWSHTRARRFQMRFVRSRLLACALHQADSARPLELLSLLISYDRWKKGRSADDARPKLEASSRRQCICVCVNLGQSPDTRSCSRQAADAQLAGNDCSRSCSGDTQRCHRYGGWRYRGPPSRLWTSQDVSCLFSPLEIETVRRRKCLEESLRCLLRQVYKEQTTTVSFHLISNSTGNHSNSSSVIPADSFFISHSLIIIFD